MSYSKGELDDELVARAILRLSKPDSSELMEVNAIVGQNPFLATLSNIFITVLLISIKDGETQLPKFVGDDFIEAAEAFYDLTSGEGSGSHIKDKLDQAGVIVSDDEMKELEASLKIAHMMKMHYAAALKKMFSDSELEELNEHIANVLKREGNK